MKTPKSSHSSALKVIALGVAGCAVALSGASASSITWDNSGTDFNDGASWVSDVAPGVSDNATFLGAANISFLPVLTASTTIQGLTFSTVTSSGYTLSNTNGAALTLTNTGTGTSGAIYAANTSGTNTISAPIVLGGSGAATFTQASGGTLAISGLISGANDLALTGTGSGSRYLLSGANTVSGTTSVSNATVAIGSSSVGTAGTVGSNGALTSSALGTGAVKFSNVAVLDLNGYTFGNRFVYTGGGSFIVGNTSSTTATVTGAMDGSLNTTNLNVISDFQVGGDNGNILWTGQISRTSGSATVTKIGSNTVTFSGTTANVGVNMAVSSGILEAGVSASSAGGLASNVTVNGGTFKFRPDLGVVSGGNLWGGQIGGTLTLTSGTVDLNGASGQNSRVQQLVGAGGTVTNSSSTAATLGIAARNNTTQTYAGIIQDGTGVVNVDFTSTGTTNTGRINLFTGANTYTGTTTISYGTFELGNALAVQNSTVIVNAAAGLGTNSTYSITTTNPLAFAGSIGTFTLGGLSGAGNIALTDIGRNSSGTAVTAASVALRVGNNNSSTTYSGVLSDGSVAGGQLTKIGSGTLTLTGLNTYTGGTTVNAGTLALGRSGGEGTVRGTITVNSGATLSTTAKDALGYNNDSTRVSQINLVGGTFNNATTENEGYRTNFNLTGATVTSTGGGAINFTNGAVITTQASSTSSVWSAPILLRDSNILSITVADGSAADDLVISGTIGEGVGTGTKGLSKAGAGRLVLTGASTYAGGTTVSAGTLMISSTGSLGNGGVTVSGGSLIVNGSTGTGAITVASGASVGGSGTIGGSVTVSSGATFGPGNSPGLLTINGALSLSGSAVMEITSAATRGTTYDATSIGGLLTYGGNLVFDLTGAGSSAFAYGTTFNLFTASSVSGDFASLSVIGVGSPYAGLTFSETGSGGTGEWTSSTTADNQYLVFSQASGTLTVVPEPSTVFLTGLGLAGMLSLCRRRRAC